MGKDPKTRTLECKTFAFFGAEYIFLKIRNYPLLYIALHQNTTFIFSGLKNTRSVPLTGFPFLFYFLILFTTKIHSKKLYTMRTIIDFENLQLNDPVIWQYVAQGLLVNSNSIIKTAADKAHKGVNYLTTSNGKLELFFSLPIKSIKFYGGAGTPAGSPPVTGILTILGQGNTYIDQVPHNINSFCSTEFVFNTINYDIHSIIFSASDGTNNIACIVDDIEFENHVASIELPGTYRELSYLFHGQAGGKEYLRPRWPINPPTPPYINGIIEIVENLKIYSIAGQNNENKANVDIQKIALSNVSNEVQKLSKSLSAKAKAKLQPSIAGKKFSSKIGKKVFG